MDKQDICYKERQQAEWISNELVSNVVEGTLWNQVLIRWTGEGIKSQMSWNSLDIATTIRSTAKAMLE
jgi:hypothetical protein